jgi:CRP/FNR family transcriptional regulator
MQATISSLPCDLCHSRKHSLFSALPETQLCAISEAKNLTPHRRGQILYYEGTKPLGIFCVNAGVIKVYKTASNGKEQILYLAKQGDFLGYSALLGEENYTNSAMIIENAKICFIPREAFLSSMMKNPDFFIKRMIPNKIRKPNKSQKSHYENFESTIMPITDTLAQLGRGESKVNR